MSKFEINRITRKLIRAILRFRFSFPPPTMYRNNIWKLFLYIVRGDKKKRKLRIALINYLVMLFIFCLLYIFTSQRDVACTTIQALASNK